MARLTIDGVSRHFERTRALDEVSLVVEEGELLAVLGPSGCGKTTLLRAIAGFDTVTGGTITIGERVVSSVAVHVPPEQRRVGIVFQSYALWPHMTVAENVGYALKIAKTPRAERERRVEDALQLVGLEGLGARSPAMLSGGQRQRVALARCLVMTPSVVLLDEPLANLDAHLRASMEAEFAGFHQRTGTTMVYITHDQAEAMALADRIAVLDRGRLLQLADPSTLYREPANEVVARFIGEGMILPARIAGSADGGRVAADILGLTTPVRAAAGTTTATAAALCLRPRDLRLAAPAEPAIEARVNRCIYQGGYFRIEARPEALPGEILRIDIPEPTGIKPGDRIRLAIADGWVMPNAPGTGAP